MPIVSQRLQKTINKILILESDTDILNIKLGIRLH